WVREVVSVKRVFPRGLEIELDYRMPYAAIEREGAYLFADSEGNILPVTSPRPVLPGPVITVTGVEGEPTSDAPIDGLWFADAVREGVAVLRELHARADHPVFQEVGIRAIDVANFRQRVDRAASEVLLVTNRNWSDEARGIVGRPVYVRWGRSRQHLLGRAQLEVGRKLDNLLAAHRLRPGFDRVGMIDIRWEDPIYRTIDALVVRR
ncbi:MAG: hypothetical protein R3F20_20045, partial [Planctomycetota bacterium]